MPAKSMALMDTYTMNRSFMETKVPKVLSAMECVSYTGFPVVVVLLK